MTAVELAEQMNLLNNQGNTAINRAPLNKEIVFSSNQIDVDSGAYHSAEIRGNEKAVTPNNTVSETVTPNIVSSNHESAVILPAIRFIPASAPIILVKNKTIVKAVPVIQKLEKENISAQKVGLKIKERVRNETAKGESLNMTMIDDVSNKLSHLIGDILREAILDPEHVNSIINNNTSFIKTIIGETAKIVAINSKPKSKKMINNQKSQKPYNISDHKLGLIKHNFSTLTVQLSTVTNSTETNRISLKAKTDIQKLSKAINSIPNSTPNKSLEIKSLLNHTSFNSTVSLNVAKNKSLHLNNSHQNLTTNANLINSTSLFIKVDNTSQSNLTIKPAIMNKTLTIKNKTNQLRNHTVKISNSHQQKPIISTRKDAITEIEKKILANIPGPKMQKLLTKVINRTKVAHMTKIHNITNITHNTSNLHIRINSTLKHKTQTLKKDSKLKSLHNSISRHNIVPNINKSSSLSPKVNKTLTKHSSISGNTSASDTTPNITSNSTVNHTKNLTLMVNKTITPTNLTTNNTVNPIVTNLKKSEHLSKQQISDSKIRSKKSEAGIEKLIKDSTSIIQEKLKITSHTTNKGSTESKNSSADIDESSMISEILKNFAHHLLKQ